MTLFQSAQKNKIMKKLQYIFAVAALALFAACGGDHNQEQSMSESEAQKQAIEIHEAASARAKEFRSDLAAAFKAAQDEGNISQELLGLDTRLQAWSKLLVKLPGMECNHAPGEHHHHDHAAEARLAEMKWVEILKIQESVSAELDSIVADLEALNAE